MLLVSLALVLLLPSVESFMARKQSPSTFSTVGSNLVVMNSNNLRERPLVETEPAKSTRSGKPLRRSPCSGSNYDPHCVGFLDPEASQSSQTPATSPSINDTAASSTIISVVPCDETTTANLPTPSATTGGVNLESFKGEVTLTFNTSTSKLFPARETKPYVIAGPESSTTNFEFLPIVPVSQTVSLGSRVTLNSANSSAVLGIQPSNRETTLPNTSSHSVVGADSIKLPALKIGSQTITANEQNRYVVSGGQPLAFASTNILTSEAPTTVLAHQASGTQTFLAPKSSTPLSSHATATPALPQIATVMTKGGQTMIANSLSQHNVDDQTLSLGSVVTSSGTPTSLASSANDAVVGTSTEALGPNAPAGLNSGPNGTEGQTPTANALGGRDGLWSSWMVMLVGIAVLLRL